jgi:hypothetical protein
MRSHEFGKDPLRVVPEVAYVYNILGDTDSALLWMRKIKDEQKVAYVLNNDLRFENLRTDSRFRELTAALRTDS